MSDLGDFKQTYFDECSELLSELEEHFAAIGGGDRSSDRLNAVFRAVHSIKGGGGAFGFSALVGFAHAYETLLDHVREGRVALSGGTVALCLRANDVLADFVAAARTGASLPAGHGDAERLQFDALSTGEGSAAATAEPLAPMEEFDIDFVPVVANVAHDKDDPAYDLESLVPPAPRPTGVWTIRFTPHAELFARANDPLLLFRELGTLGRLTVRASVGNLPPLSDFEPFGVYCEWELTLDAPAASEAQILEVFEFVEGNCDLVVTPLVAAAPPLPGAARDDDPDHMPQFADLIAAEIAEATGVEPPPLALEPAVEESLLALADTMLREAAVDRLVPDVPAPIAAEVMPEVVAPAVPPAVETDRRNGVQSIRVDLDKVDRVVNMVGELVITQSMLTQQMDDVLRARYQELVRGLEVLAQTTRGLQDSVMAIRAQPVKSVFSRLPRLVRELAQRTGKKIRLETFGENTEIDKTMIEQLADPLTHMIRNSADHGIEPPAARLAAGKPEVGVIRLSAEQAGGNILIAVEDDGAGINRERVLRIARERGVVGLDQQLNDEQIDQLIFAPGFSTAETVTDISGRGVGMDVVLANVKRVGGSVHVRSATGKGTRMTLRLPLTLAVLDVMLVRVAGNPYVIPLSSIVETIQCARAEFGRAPSGARVLRVRGEYVQVIDLCERFDLPPASGLRDRFVVLCEAEGASRVAVIVDDILGQQQVVIKSLEENFERIEGIAGGTILGDGNVALIIDPQGLRATSSQRRAA